MPGSSRPDRVAVIGAGMLGLSTAWFLQQEGLQVTVLDRANVGAGASAGNAGWITPALVSPLPDPVILREGMRALAARSPAVHLPAVPGPALLSFLWRFARNSTPRRRDAAQSALDLLSGHAIAAFDALLVGGVDALVSSGHPVVAAYRDPAGRAPLVAELEHVGRHGGPRVEYDLLDGAAVQQAEPVLGPGARAAVRIHGQRYMDPAAFVGALASSVRLRGGRILGDTKVTSLQDDGAGVTVASRPVGGTAGAEDRYDCVVVATGAWLGQLARPAGARTRVQSGRGYSFIVPVRHLPAGPSTCLLSGWRARRSPTADCG